MAELNQRIEETILAREAADVEARHLAEIRQLDEEQHRQAAADRARAEQQAIDETREATLAEAAAGRAAEERARLSIRARAAALARERAEKELAATEAARVEAELEAVRVARTREETEKQAVEAVRERVRIEQEALDAAQARLDAENTTREAAQVQLAAEREATAAADELLRVETERTEALRAVADADRQQITHKRNRIKVARDRIRAHEQAAVQDARAIEADGGDEFVSVLPVGASLPLPATQTIEVGAFGASAVQEPLPTAFEDEDATGGFVAVEADPDVVAIEALNEHIAGELAAHAPDAGMEAGAFDAHVRARIAELSRPVDVVDDYTAEPSYRRARRSYRGAVAGGVTVTLAAVTSWIFLGWSPYTGSAEAGHDDTIKPITVAPTRPRLPAASLSTLDLPGLSLRMRLDEPGPLPDDGSRARN